MGSPGDSCGYPGFTVRWYGSDRLAAMTDQGPIYLTPAPFGVFEATWQLFSALESQGKLLWYSELRSECVRRGICTEKSFSHNIEILNHQFLVLVTRKGFADKPGSKGAVVEPKLPLSATERVLRLPRNTNINSRPLSDQCRVEKKRKCLARVGDGNCNKMFKSKWAGDRICKTCRENPNWKEGNSPFEVAGGDPGGRCK